MKAAAVFFWLKSACVASALPLFAGCSFHGLSFIRNLTDSPVLVRIVWGRAYYGAWVKAPRTLKYAPVLLPPKQQSLQYMHDSLAASSTASTLAFQLPAKSTVLVEEGVNTLAIVKALRLQRADSCVQTFDSTSLARVAHVKMLGGPRVWYDIKASSP